jgi:KDO2-lipid IV(A) lauroyltransferase
LGTFTFHVLRIRRRVVDVNLSLAFPEKTPRERKALALAHYRSLGLGVFETCLAWWTPASRLPPFKIEGLEHLLAAKAKGKGVLLLTAHFTTLEICARMLLEHTPFVCLYRKANNAVIAEQMRICREARTEIAVPMEDLRGLLRALKAGHIILYLPDQGRRTKLSAVLPFFGVPAITNTATNRLAEMTGAAVVPYFGARLPDGSYRLTILPALDHFPSADAEADSIRINRLFEDYIRRAPDQYFWIHRRFKRRGKGLTNVYK